MCGSFVPCSVYYQLYPFNIQLKIHYTFIFQLTNGYNLLYLNQTLLMKKGYFIIINQTNAKLAIDTNSTNIQYSDLQLTNNLWTKLNNTINTRLYFDTIDNFNSYQTNFNIQHTYQNIGIYTLTFTFPASNQIFQHIINVTDCNNFLIF